MDPSILRKATPVQLAFLLLAVILVAAVIINPGFASAGAVRAQLSIGAVIGTVAIGQTILIISGQIDLSIPWAMTAAGMTMSALHGSGYGDMLCIAAALGVGLLIGVCNTIGVALFRVQSLVWTLAMNTLVQGLVLVITSSQPPKGGVPATIRTLAVGTVAGLPWAGLLWGVLAILTIITMRRTVLGRVIYATGINPIATFFSGIDVRRTYLFGFVLSGFCAALGGALLTGYTSEAYLGMGDDYMLLPIAAVVIGGTSILGGSGSYLGTIAGVLIMLILQSTLSLMQIAQGGREIILGLLILATIVAYGRRDALRA
jgi:ribose transport system permease protein